MQGKHLDSVGVRLNEVEEGHNHVVEVVHQAVQASSPVLFEAVREDESHLAAARRVRTELVVDDSLGSKPDHEVQSLEVDSVDVSLLENE